MMKRAILVLAVALAAVAVEAKGLLPCMVYRRGLTNEQIEQILVAHPDAQLRITVQDWRGMQYQLHRFANMTNYVDRIANSNDAARVLLELHDARDMLTSLNADLARDTAKWRKVAEELQATAEALRADSSDAWATVAAATNRLADVKADYASVSNKAAWAEARIASITEWAEEQRDKAKLPSTKDLWQTLIDRIEQD